MKNRLLLYGRNSVSGTYGYFKKQALCKGDAFYLPNDTPRAAGDSISDPSDPLKPPPQEAK